MSSALEPQSALELLKYLEEYVQPYRRSGLYRARIEELDTDLADRNGRCRVRIYGMHEDDVPVNTLPWAEYCHADGGGENYGDFHIPYNIGDTVFVMFEHGEPEFPVIVGTWRSRKPPAESEIPKECNSDSSEYPNRRIMKTRYGHRIEMSDESENLEIVIRTGIYKDPDYPQPEDGSNVEERRITIRDTDDYGLQICTHKGFIHMNDAESKMTMYWDGDYEEHITGNKTVVIDGEKEETIGKSFKLTIGKVWDIIVASATKVSSPKWTWTGDKHTRNGKTFDSGPNDHGP